MPTPTIKSLQEEISRLSKIIDMERLGHGDFRRKIASALNAPNDNERIFETLAELKSRDISFDKMIIEKNKEIDRLMYLIRVLIDDESVSKDMVASGRDMFRG